MKNFLYRLEIAFWDIFLPLMINSRPVKWIIRLVYPFVEGLNIRQIITALAITSMSGFFIGWLAIYTYMIIK
jgi:hypothetical protein